MTSRRDFIKFVAGTGFVLFAHGTAGVRRALAAIPGGTLHPGSVTKYLTPLLIPPVMPKAPSGQGKVGPGVDYYEIAYRQSSSRCSPHHFLQRAFGLMVRLKQRVESRIASRTLLR